jgi:Concanavalin A-like lectin/glucanases superfamily
MPALPKIPRVQPWKTTAKGLVSCWPCFEGTGAALHDVSGYAVDGAFQGAALPVWVDAPAGYRGEGTNALDFSGANYASFGAGLYLPAFSIASWLYPTSFTDYGNIVCRGAADRNYSLYLTQTTGTLNLYATQGGSASVLTTAAPLAQNHWSFICGSYDGSTAKIYLDGVLSASATWNISPDNAGPLQLGTAHGDTTNGFIGIIGETRIYDRALAPSEVWDIWAENN